MLIIGLMIDYVRDVFGSDELAKINNLLQNQSLESLLSSNGGSLEEFNDLIAGRADYVGYGTREAVVSVATTLIAEIANKYRLPYYRGGEHGITRAGVNGNWGAKCSRKTSTYGTSYDYCGMDCSGFVPWVIENAGFTISHTIATTSFGNLQGVKKVNLTNNALLKPGDLMYSSALVSFSS